MVLANKTRICICVNGAAILPSHDSETNEAVAHGFATLCGNEWVAQIAEGLSVVKASVSDVRVEHEVRLKDFTRWLDRNGGSPREVALVIGFDPY